MNELREDLVQFDARVKQMDEKIALEAKGNVAVKRLKPLPGIGPISATALVAAVGDAKNFKCGREQERADCLGDPLAGRGLPGAGHNHERARYNHERVTHRGE